MKEGFVGIFSHFTLTSWMSFEISSIKWRKKKKMILEGDIIFEFPATYGFLGFLSRLTFSGLFASNFLMYWIRSICSGLDKFLKLSSRDRSSGMVKSSKSSKLSPPPPPEDKTGKYLSLDILLKLLLSKLTGFFGRFRCLGFKFPVLFRWWGRWTCPKHTASSWKNSNVKSSKSSQAPGGQFWSCYLYKIVKHSILS